MDYKRDPVLRVLKRDVLGGQLSQDPRVANFGRIFSELSISAGGNVIRGERLVLPQKLQPHAIQLAHGGSHLGASSAKRRLRTVIWFPGMDRAIDHFVSQCKTCQTVTEKYAKVEQQPHATPTLPWESVSIDHFGPLPDRSHILVARCDLSRFPTATFVRSTSSEDTISALTEIYSAFGFPRTQRSDNGAAFKSVRFQQFCNKHAIDHKFTAPYHPRANPAETFMKVLKKTFQSCGGSKKEMRQVLQACLRAYRTTPHPVTKVPPSSLLFSHFRTELPAVLGIPTKELEVVRRRDVSHRENTARNFNAHSRIRPSSILPGCWVLLRNYVRPSKFHTKFNPTAHRVLNKQGHATFLVRNETTQATFIRHEDDIKVITEPGDKISAASSAHQPVPLWIDQPRREEPPPAFPLPYSTIPSATPSRTTSTSSPDMFDPTSTRPSRSSVSSSSSGGLGHLRPDPESQHLLNRTLQRFQKRNCKCQPVAEQSITPPRRSSRKAKAPDLFGFGQIQPQASDSRATSTNDKKSSSPKI